MGEKSKAGPKELAAKALREAWYSDAPRPQRAGAVLPPTSRWPANAVEEVRCGGVAAGASALQAECDALRADVRRLKRELAEAHARVAALEAVNVVNIQPVDNVNAVVDKDVNRKAYFREYMRKRRAAKKGKR